MRRLVRRPSVAVVIACGALFVALSDTSLATVTEALLPNSVGEVQLRASAVTSEKVKDETLQVIDLSPRARAALAAGSVGPAGPAGPKGAQGARGLSGLEIIQATTPENSMNGKHATAYCRGGRKVIGGGAAASRWTILPYTVNLVASEPVHNASGAARNRDGWHAQAIELSPKDLGWSLTAYAICAFVDQ